MIGVEASLRARRAGIVVAILAGATVGGSLLALAVGKVGLVRSITGVVLMQSTDPAKQFPISNVEVTASARTGSVSAVSDTSGLFRIALPEGLWRGETFTLSFSHPGYLPIRETQGIHNEMYLAWMSSKPANQAAGAEKEAILSDIRVRYLSKGATTSAIGSLVRTFQVKNQGDMPCRGQSPCSPDGRWKAATSGLKLDAGEGQEFRNARVSCVAGPCPYTRIESDEFSHGGRVISVSVRNWSDTTTFLLEAEVVRTVASDEIRQAYPAIFGRLISFTLPMSAQGPSFEAELNGLEITFPLGPDLLLSWARCNLKVEPNQTKLYSCELKPGYRVKS
jgi:hypothetical protein